MSWAFLELGLKSVSFSKRCIFQSSFFVALILVYEIFHKLVCSGLACLPNWLWFVVLNGNSWLKKRVDY